MVEAPLSTSTIITGFLKKFINFISLPQLMEEVYFLLRHKITTFALKKSIRFCQQGGPGFLQGGPGPPGPPRRYGAG